jgi:hypothetical protein
VYDADLATGFRSAFNGPLKKIPDTGAEGGVRCMRLVAVNAVIQTDLPKLPGKPKILRTCQRMGRKTEGTRMPIVIAHSGHSKIPGIKAGFRTELDGSFFTDKIGGGFNFC